MKIGIRKPSIKKVIAARNPVTQIKRKYSIKKYTDPIGTAKKRVYNKVYNKITISIFDPIIIGSIVIWYVLFKVFIWY